MGKEKRLTNGAEAIYVKGEILATAVASQPLHTQHCSSVRNYGKRNKINEWGRSVLHWGVTAPKLL